MLLGLVPVFEEGRQIVDTFALVRETEGLLSHVCPPDETLWPVLNYNCFQKLYAVISNRGVGTPIKCGKRSHEIRRLGKQ